MPGQIAEEVVQTRGLKVYTEPYSSGNALPADSAYGTAWGGSWVEKGFSDGGLNVNMSMNYDDVTVDQSVYPIFTIGTAGDIHFVTNLVQLTALNLQQAIGGQGSIATVAASSGVRGRTTLAIDGTVNVNYITVGYDIRHPGDGEALRPIIWKGQARGNPQMSFTGTAKAAFPLDVQAYPDTANASRVMTWVDIIPALP
jgi:hypothetical protein